MTTWIALLRGVNVGGSTRVGMTELRGLVEGLGHSAVTTYLQSGNLVFSSSSGDQSSVRGALEEAIATRLGVSTSVLLRTPGELVAVLDGNPFLERGAEISKLHVTFLAEKPTAAKRGQLERPDGESAEFVLQGREVFLYCPDGYGRTKLNNAFIERRLGVIATTRNWRTVNRLRELAG